MRLWSHKVLIRDTSAEDYGILSGSNLINSSSQPGSADDISNTVDFWKLWHAERKRSVNKWIAE